VAQVCFREQWDREMIKVADGFKPLPNWEERIANAMRACKQDKHLTKEGVPVGPVCPRLAKRLFSAGGSASANPSGHGRPFGGANGRGSSSGRGGGRGGRRGGRCKENSKPGRSAAAAAAPAAAPGAAAAAAGGRRIAPSVAPPPSWRAERQPRPLPSFPALPPGFAPHLANQRGGGGGFGRPPGLTRRGARPPPAPHRPYLGKGGAKAAFALHRGGGMPHPQRHVPRARAPRLRAGQPAGKHGTSQDRTGRLRRPRELGIARNYIPFFKNSLRVSTK